MPIGALLVTIIAGYVAFNAIKMGWLTTGQTSGSGLPLEWTFYPMGVGALFMTVFALELFCARPLRDMIAGIVATADHRRRSIWRGISCRRTRCRRRAR